MKKLILYTLLFLIPFIGASIYMEYLLRKIPNDYILKNRFLEKNANQIKILSLGSSHGANDISPKYFEKYAFNGAHVSQSLDIDFAIISKYKNNFDSLEYILVPVSYHSLFSKLEVGIEEWRSKYYNIYYNIRIETNPFKISELFEGTMKNNIYRLRSFYYNKNVTDVHIDSLGFLSMKPTKDSIQFYNSSEAAAQRHTSPNLDLFLEDNISSLHKIIRIGNELNAKVIFFTPPFHISYRSLLNKEQMDKTIDILTQLKDDTNIFYYDFMNSDTKYFFEDFTNGDHLSYLGAKKFTLELDSIIQIIDKK